VEGEHARGIMEGQGQREEEKREGEAYCLHMTQLSCHIFRGCCSSLLPQSFSLLLSYICYHLINCHKPDITYLTLI
jgi:hypothetical protein